MFFEVWGANMTHVHHQTGTTHHTTHRSKSCGKQNHKRHVITEKGKIQLATRPGGDWTKQLKSSRVQVICLQAQTKFGNITSC